MEVAKSIPFPVAEEKYGNADETHEEDNIAAMKNEETETKRRKLAKEKLKSRFNAEYDETNKHYMQLKEDLEKQSEVQFFFLSRSRPEMTKCVEFADYICPKCRFKAQFTYSHVCNVGINEQHNVMSFIFCSLSVE